MSLFLNFWFADSNSCSNRRCGHYASRYSSFPSSALVFLVALTSALTPCIPLQQFSQYLPPTWSKLSLSSHIVLAPVIVVAMPHTSHRKRKATQTKRQEIIDEDGWTRITSYARPSTTPTMTEYPLRPSDGAHHAPRDFPPSSVAPMPPQEGSTLDILRARFLKIQARWLDTTLCKNLEETLTHRILPTSPQISSSVLFGTGSFCGDAVHWVDRHESAYFQLAAFFTLADVIREVQGNAVMMYAQEPYYNELDKALLKSLEVVVVDEGKGFEILDDKAFAYSPAAERKVELRILERNPLVWLHRGFDHHDRDDEEEGNKAGKQLAWTFQQSHSHEQLPGLDVKNFPFHSSVLWFLSPEDSP